MPAERVKNIYFCRILYYANVIWLHKGLNIYISSEFQYYENVKKKQKESKIYISAVF